ncbi:hypothetical protein FB446DRAFT_714170 [Lentinula raphanica]|nr:hypothetical protein FB446DRAFT_714170 [Lentinula raphanica]
MEILLPWILPIFVADEENRRLDPKTVPDLHSSFRVSELSYEGSYTTGRESIVPRDQAKHFHMPRDGWSVGIDEYWLYLMILGSNGMPRARLVICLVYPERYQQGKLGVEDFLFGTTALEGRVGYGHNLVKNQITLIRPNGLLTTCDGEMIDFSVEKSRWQPSGLAPRKTMELGGETTFSFQEGFVRSVKGGEGSGEGSEGGGGGGAEDVAKGDKPSNWKTRMRQRLPFVSKS